MDNRFTKKRIVNMLSYDWLKMVALIVAIVFIWSLAYTIGAPRASKGQSFGISYYYGDNGFKFKMGPEDYGTTFKNAGVFSYDILDIEVREVGAEYPEMLLMTTSIVQSGDVMITVDREDKVQDFKSEFRFFVDRYAEEIYDFQTLIADAKSYCLSNDLVRLDNDKYVLDEDKIQQFFAVRMQKDPRFKKKGGERYLQGVKDEIQRIKSLWNNAVMLEDCLNNHPELTYYYQRFEQSKLANPKDYEGEEYQNQVSKNYGLNLGSLHGGEYTVTDEFYYNLTDEEGKTIGRSANGIVLCVYNYKEYQPHLQYETIAFVNAVISRYSNFINVNCDGII